MKKLFFVIILGFIVCSFANCGKSNGSVECDKDSISVEDIVTTHNEIVEEVPNWSYYYKIDEMRNDTTKFAETMAIDNGDCSLFVRKSPKFGNDIYICDDNYWFDVKSYETSYMNVKFDNGTIKKYRILPPDDSVADMVFVYDYKGFLAELKNSETLIVEITAINHGDIVYKFNVKDLKWE